MSQLFETKEVKIQTLAEYLSLSRQKLNLDIKTVSMLTGIKPSYLESLEAADRSSLPAEVYIKGFLKQLAKVYQVKEADLIDKFEKESKYAEKNLTAKPSGMAALRKIRINPK